jgi:hypothetical protein
MGPGAICSILVERKGSEYVQEFLDQRGLRFLLKRSLRFMDTNGILLRFVQPKNDRALNISVEWRGSVIVRTIATMNVSRSNDEAIGLPQRGVSFETNEVLEAIRVFHPSKILERKVERMTRQVCFVHSIAMTLID